MKGYLLKKALAELEIYYLFLDKLSAAVNLADYNHLDRLSGLLDAIEAELKNDTKQEVLPK